MTTKAFEIVIFLNWFKSEKWNLAKEENNYPEKANLGGILEEKNVAPSS
jgi:hypothetical protein